MVTYLPTIILNVINQVTNCFEGTIFSGDIIKVNLTSMMVLSALYISVSNSLPATASVKYVDIWLIFSLIYPFLIVFTQTFIQKNKTLKSKKSTVWPAEESSIRTNKLNRVRAGEMVAYYWIPGIGLIFTIIYFCVGLSWVLLE